MAAELETSAEKEAAFWFARLRSDDLGEEDRARFSRWLAADPANVSAYADYQGLWSDLDDVAASAPVLAMREQALDMAPRRRSFRWGRLAAIAASVAVVLAGGWTFSGFGGLALRSDDMASRSDGMAVQPGVTLGSGGASATYRTEVGERSTITLSDGSNVELNTDSVLQVEYADARRGLRLLQGQALFQVAHDPARPFVVEAGGQRITALGTTFDVRVGSGETRVTLIEGKIAVERDGGTVLFPLVPEARRLIAGEQLVAIEERPFMVREADVQKAVSWRSGQVIFSDEPLGQVIEEINRYSIRKVVLGEGTLGELKVSGVFKAGSAERFVAALELGFPVDGQLDEGRDVIVLRRR